MTATAEVSGKGVGSGSFDLTVSFQSMTANIPSMANRDLDILTSCGLPLRGLLTVHIVAIRRVTRA